MNIYIRRILSRLRSDVPLTERQIKHAAKCVAYLSKRGGEERKIAHDITLWFQNRADREQPYCSIRYITAKNERDRFYDLISKYHCLPVLTAEPDPSKKEERSILIPAEYPDFYLSSEVK